MYYLNHPSRTPAPQTQGQVQTGTHKYWTIQNTNSTVFTDSGTGPNRHTQILNHPEHQLHSVLTQGQVQGIYTQTLNHPEHHLHSVYRLRDRCKPAHTNAEPSRTRTPQCSQTQEQVQTGTHKCTIYGNTGHQNNVTKQLNLISR